MSYFNHAFCKSFAPIALEGTAGEKTIDLLQQEISVVGENWLTLDPTVALPGKFYIVQGAYTDQDKIGNNPGHGGYTESIKSGNTGLHSTIGDR